VVEGFLTTGATKLAELEKKEVEYALGMGKKRL